jgi:hypothetical protein
MHQLVVVAAVAAAAVVVTEMLANPIFDANNPKWL